MRNVSLTILAVTGLFWFGSENLSASGVERLDIDFGRDSKQLPIYFTEQQSFDFGGNRVHLGRSLQVFQLSDVSGKDPIVIVGKNGPFGSGELTSFMVIDVATGETLSEDPIDISLTDFVVATEPRTGTVYAVGSGMLGDSAVVVRTVPGTNRFDLLFLLKGEDQSGDGRWTGLVQFMAQSDYDLDGRLELFVYTTAGRDIGPRRLACIELDPFRIEWTREISSVIDRQACYICPDSLEPRLLFTSYGPQNGAADDLFDDRYGYLAALGPGGEVEFAYRTLANFGASVLTEIDTNSHEFCFYHNQGITEGQVAAPDDIRGHWISIVDKSGDIQRSTAVSEMIRSIWTMPYDGSEEAHIYLLGVSGVVSVYSGTLELVAQSGPAQLSAYLGQLSLAGHDGPVLVFGESGGLAFYSTDFDKLAVYEKPDAQVQPLVTKDGEAVSLVISGSNRGSVVEVHRRSVWLLFISGFQERQELVLTILIILTIGLVATNALRLRASRRLRVREQILSSVFNNMQDGFYRSDLNGYVTWVSPSCSWLLGNDENFNLIGSNVSDFYLYPDKRQALTDEMSKSGRVTDWLVELKRLDGKQIVVSTNSNFYYDRKGKVAGIEGVFRDMTHRLEMEQALKLSEKQYRSLVENVDAAICLITSDGVFEFINEVGAADLGQSAESIKGQSLYDLFPPRLAEQKTATIKEVIKTGEEFNGEVQTIISGKWYWYQVHVQVYHGMKGVAPVAMVIAHDITERKRMEEALRGSEEKYRGIFDDSVATIYIFDNEKNFIDSNQSGLDLLGYSREELLSMKIPDVDSSPPVVLSAHKQLLAGDKLYNYEHQLRRKDGGIITVLNNSRPLTDARGMVIGMQSTLIDITDRKKAEETLRHRVEIETLVASISTDFVSKSVDEIDKGIEATLGTVGEFIRADRGYLFWLQDDIELMRVTHKWHSPGTDSIKDTVEQVPLNQIPWWTKKLRSLQYIALRSPSDLPEEAITERNYVESVGAKSVLAVPLKLHGNLIGSLHFACLRTERGWPEEDIRMLNVIGEIFVNALEQKHKTEEVARVNRERLDQEQQIAGGFAHEIRNALFPARGILDKLVNSMTNGERSENHQAYSKMVDDSLTRAIDIVGSILKYTRLGSQRMEERVSVRETVNEVIKTNQLELEKANLKLFMEGDDRASVLCNSQQLYMALNNLVLNAVDAVASHPEPELRIEWTSRNGQIIIRVSDNGQGMTPEIQSRIFEAFYSTKPDRGTGLGLATVKKIVTLYAGRVEVQSVPGQGTTFLLVLRDGRQGQ